MRQGDAQSERYEDANGDRSARREREAKCRTHIGSDACGGDECDENTVAECSCGRRSPRERRGNWDGQFDEAGHRKGESDHQHGKGCDESRRLQLKPPTQRELRFRDDHRIPRPAQLDVTPVV